MCNLGYFASKKFTVVFRCSFYLGNLAFKTMSIFSQSKLIEYHIQYCYKIYNIRLHFSV